MGVYKIGSTSMAEDEDRDAEIMELKERVDELEAALDSNDDEQFELTERDFKCPQCGLTARSFRSPDAALAALSAHIADKHGLA